MKAAWQRTRLSVQWWSGPVAEAGDELVTKTGRRYLIIDAKPKRLECLVLPADTPPASGRVFEWTWARRARREPRALGGRR